MNKMPLGIEGTERLSVEGAKDFSLGAEKALPSNGAGTEKAAA